MGRSQRRKREQVTWVLSCLSTLGALPGRGCWAPVAAGPCGRPHVPCVLSCSLNPMASLISTCMSALLFW